MSSTDTLVCKDKWERMKKKIVDNEAFIVDSEATIKKLNDLALHRQKKTEDYAKMAKDSLDKSTVALADMYDSKVKDLVSKKVAVMAMDHASFAQELEEVRSKAQATDVKVADLDKKINAVVAAYQGIIEDYAKTIADLADRTSFEINALNELCAQIQDLHPARFAADEYNTLVNAAANINTNVGNKNYEAALMQAQHSVAEATTLLVNLLAMNESYNAKYSGTRANLDELMNEIAAFSAKEATLNVFGENYKYDIDYWSFGKFSKLCSEVEKLNAALEGNQLNLDDLLQMDESIAVLAHNLDVIDNAARFERGCAIVIEDKKNELLQEMQETGWKLVSGKYEEDDERNPYIAEFEDGSGNRVSVVIKSEDSKTAETSSEVFVEDMDDTEHIERIKEYTEEALRGKNNQSAHTYVNDDCEENTDSDTFIANTMSNAMEALAERRNVFA